MVVSASRAAAAAVRCVTASASRRSESISIGRPNGRPADCQPSTESRRATTSAQLRPVVTVVVSVHRLHPPSRGFSRMRWRTIAPRSGQWRRTGRCDSAESLRGAAGRRSTPPVTEGAGRPGPRCAPHRVCPVPSKLSHRGSQRCRSAPYDSSRWDGSTSPLRPTYLSQISETPETLRWVDDLVVAGQRGRSRSR